MFYSICSACSAHVERSCLSSADRCVDDRPHTWLKKQAKLHISFTFLRLFFGCSSCGAKLRHSTRRKVMQVCVRGTGRDGGPLSGRCHGEVFMLHEPE